MSNSSWIVIYIIEIAPHDMFQIGQVAGRCDMMVNSRYLVRDAPTTCAHCKRPFPVVIGHVEAWRTSVGGYFCNEFCAEDEEEASFQDHMRAS